MFFLEICHILDLPLILILYNKRYNNFFQDGSGTITTKELLPVLRSIGQNPTEDEILGLVIEYDVNGDGTIDFEEFIQMMSRVNKNICCIICYVITLKSTGYQVVVLTTFNSISAYGRDSGSNC